MSISSIILFTFTLVFGGLGVRCINEGRKGGDFGQIYSWALGIYFIGITFLFGALGIRCL